MRGSSITFLQNQLPQVFYEKAVLKNFAIFTEKHLCWSLFLIKLWTLRPATLLKRDCNTCFPVNIAKFLRISILKNIRERLLLPLQVFYKGFVDISHKNASFRTIKTLRFGLWNIFFGSTGATSECLLKILLYVVFIAQISHYGKFTVLHKSISIVLQLTNQVKISSEIMRCQGKTIYVNI